DSVTAYSFCAPLSDIVSLIVHPPSLTQWHGSVIINANSNNQTITFPPLWFHDSESASTIAGEGLIWGGDQLLAWISREKHVQQSASDPTLYLVSASPPTTFPPSPPAQFPKSLSASWTPPTIDSLLGAMSPLVSTLKTTQWNILEGFSKVTRFTREAAQSVVEHPLARPILPHLPSQVREFASPSYNAATNSEVSREYEGARLYLAKWAASNMERLRKANDSSNDAQEGSSVSDELGQFELLSGSANAGLPPLLRSREPSPVTLTEWNSMLDDNGALVESAEHVRRLVFSRGVHADARCIVWKYLLGVYPWSSSEEERRVIDRTGADLYYEMKMAWLQDADTLASEEIVEQKSRIKKDVLRTDRTVPMFAPSEQYHPDHRDDENEDGDGDGDGEGEGLPGTNYNLEQMKDILLSYHFHNRALGYVQGMSDLLAPIYYVVADEAQAFWCFARFMDRMQSHFLRDQSGMSRELDCLKDLVRLLLPRLYSHLQSMDALHFFFCFRWLLIWFKREFEFMDVIALWEVFWTDYLSGDFHLFVAVAILELHSDVIVDHLERFDEVLKYINDLSMNIDVNQVLRGAEQMYYRLQRAVNLSDQQSD
ncbi:RabGAP/TBC, partial [Ramicandelaber brevisporus]